jgi:ATP-dependent Zn protease
MRLAFPLWLALYMVKFAFRLGRKKQRDKLFGGVRMDMVKSRDIAISFNDVAGIDQVFTLPDIFAVGSDRRTNTHTHTHTHT